MELKMTKREAEVMDNVMRDVFGTVGIFMAQDNGKTYMEQHKWGWEEFDGNSFKAYITPKCFGQVMFVFGEILKKVMPLIQQSDDIMNYISALMRQVEQDWMVQPDYNLPDNAIYIDRSSLTEIRVMNNTSAWYGRTINGETIQIHKNVLKENEYTISKRIGDKIHTQGFRVPVCEDIDIYTIEQALAEQLKIGIK